MSEQLTRIEVDCSTGEQKVIPLTAAEIAELDQMRAKAEEEAAQRKAEEEAKAAAKAAAEAKLAALGLTSEEIAALSK
jgi:F0F1-type ATP synthase epsilon subunit